MKHSHLFFPKKRQDKFCLFQKYISNNWLKRKINKDIDKENYVKNISRRSITTASTLSIFIFITKSDSKISNPPMILFRHGKWFINLRRELKSYFLIFDHFFSHSSLTCFMLECIFVWSTHDLRPSFNFIGGFSTFFFFLVIRHIL